MSRGRSCLGFVVFLLVLSCIVLEVVLFVVDRWRGERAPRREFEAESLLMDATLFPGGWWDRGVTTRPLTKWVYSDGCHALQQLYRRYYLNESKQLYQRYLGSKFSRREHFQEEWQPRPDLCAEMTFADECYAACAYYGMWYGEDYQYVDEQELHCGVLARYQEYVTHFHARVVPPYLRVDDLGSILRGIDQRFAVALRLKGAPDKVPEETGP